MNAARSTNPLPLPPPAPPRTPRKQRAPRWLALAGALALTVAAFAGTATWALQGDAPVSYRTAPITEGDLKQIVSATGKLSADTTVLVGTQVSGVVTELLVDYNDTVTAGQVLARIDPTLLAADVASAKASLGEREAQYTLATSQLTRTAFLADHGAATAADLESAKAQEASARAQVTSGKVALERAERNLTYATIKAPIDGIVVDRAVNVGQTVNAGTSAPTLYTLAGDLHRMQILATVDEADIGLVATGQPVQVSVSAYPTANFSGAVRQVRMQSTTADNVVTYIVVVDVENADGKLLPGMTANVAFVVAATDGADLVPASALRFRPAAATGPEGAPRDASGARGASDKGARSGRNADGVDSHRGVVWVLGDDGMPQRLVVTTGISDGTTTAISGEGVTPGMQVITGLQTATTAATTATSSPFKSATTNAQRGPGRPGGF